MPDLSIFNILNNCCAFYVVLFCRIDFSFRIILAAVPKESNEILRDSEPSKITALLLTKL
jgi:hypothetical protein